MQERRDFLQRAGMVAIGIAVPALSGHAQPQEAKKPEEQEEVTPTEDLMREHGLLNRVMLIYDHAGRQLETGASFDPALLKSAAGIIHRFIEDYHEKLEENHLFPRFEKAGKLTDLVKVLREQHVAGRKVTAAIEGFSTAAALKNASDRQKLQAALHSFVRMYRPHEAREDTVLFPALHEIVSPHDWDAMGEEFEKREHELFGKEGFEGEVVKVGELEKALGIYELAQFTAKS